MNGYKLMAASYREAVALNKISEEMAERKIRIYDFLNECDKSDIYDLFDSSAFNDILAAYINTACIEAGLGQEQVKSVNQALQYLINTKTAEEVCTCSTSL